MKVKSYAKINLSLKVTGVREDGYHNLDMLMININLYDVLKFEKSNCVKVDMDKDVCKMEDNIIYKTVMYIKEKYNIKEGICVYVKKRIPQGGGLGGGSSNAASTIIALNKLWDLKLSEDEMISIAKKIGGDVPFFIVDSFSRVQGIGESIKEIDIPFNKKIVLVIPNIKCDTKNVYNHWRVLSNNDIDDIDLNNYDNLFNDLELATIEAYPEYELGKIKKVLISNGCKSALMTGSGSCVFGIYDRTINMKKIKEQLSDCAVIKNKTISSCKNKYIEL